MNDDQQIVVAHHTICSRDGGDWRAVGREIDGSDCDDGIVRCCSMLLMVDTGAK